MTELEIRLLIIVVMWFSAGLFLGYQAGVNGEVWAGVGLLVLMVAAIILERMWLRCPQCNLHVSWSRETARWPWSLTRSGGALSKELSKLRDVLGQVVSLYSKSPLRIPPIAFVLGELGFRGAAELSQ